MTGKGLALTQDLFTVRRERINYYPPEKEKRPKFLPATSFSIDSRRLLKNEGPGVGSYCRWGSSPLSSPP